jgi:hypothetical protein
MLSLHFLLFLVMIINQSSTKVEDEALPFIYVHVFMLSLILIPSFNFIFIRFNSVLVTKIVLNVV